MSEEVTKKIEIKCCLDCPFHKVIADPDPHDWFCADDEAVVCTREKNENQDKNSLYAADRQEYRTVTVSCRPYNRRKESSIPKWCPL